jgi:hypothetical protein
VSDDYDTDTTQLLEKHAQPRDDCENGTSGSRWAKLLEGVARMCHESVEKLRWQSKWQRQPILVSLQYRCCMRSCRPHLVPSSTCKGHRTALAMSYTTARVGSNIIVASTALTWIGLETACCVMAVSEANLGIASLSLMTAWTLHGNLLHSMGDWEQFSDQPEEKENWPGGMTWTRRLKEERPVQSPLPRQTLTLKAADVQQIGPTGPVTQALLPC